MPKEYENEEKIDSLLPIEAPSLENMSSAERASYGNVLPVTKGGTGTNNGSMRVAGSFKLETTTDPRLFVDDDLPSIHLQAFNSTQLGLNGGTIRLSGGDGRTSGSGGGIELLAGAGAVTGDGGSVDVVAGNGGTTSGAGASVTITAGDAPDGVSGGGGVFLKPGLVSGYVGLQGAATTSTDTGTGSAAATRETHFVGKTTTTDATQTTCFTQTMAANSMMHIEAFVAARRTGGTGGTNGDCAGYTFYGTYQKVGAGGATLVGAVSATHTAENQAAWDATFTVSGNNVLLSVTGAIDNNVTWRWSIKYIKVSL